MKRAEFLQLDAGVQRWVLLKALNYAFAMLLPSRMRPRKVRRALVMFDRHVERAARGDE